MPTIELSKKDLFGLIGKNLTSIQLDEDILLAKGEIEHEEGEIIKVEIADTNRPDLWSAEGVARDIRTKYGNKKVDYSKLKKSGVIVKVDKNLKNIRPMTVCAVIRNINITPDVLSQLIQLQEKVCETFGSKRKEAAIGVYDLHKITSPIIYKAFKPKEIKFIPLEFEQEMDLGMILRRHPKGQEYAHLLEPFDKYPIFIDSVGEVLSMPPVINSNHTGKVTEKTKDLFIECSGFEMKYISPALNVIVAALADRGGKIETVEVIYDKKKIITPELKPNKIEVKLSYIEKITGLKLGSKKIIELLKKANYNFIKEIKDTLVLEYPAYRQDIMHPIDVVEDVAIRYGYNNFEPVVPEMYTAQKILPINVLSKNVANILTGIGSQEIMSYTLNNKDVMITKMNLKDLKYIEIDNPVSKNWSIFRPWIMPCLIEFFGKNTNKEYPQEIFEIGEVVLFDKNAQTRTQNPTRIAWSKADKAADFTIAKQAFDYLMRRLGLEYEMKEELHDSFIKGRVGRAYINNKAVAYIGEINPSVLENFGIEMPVCAFELNLTEITKEVLK
jgi:phenylalanyl-tRNA synthetase beta chain